MLLVGEGSLIEVLSLLPELPRWGNALRTFRLCGTQPMPERSGAGLLPTGRLAIPTWPLASSLVGLVRFRGCRSRFSARVCLVELGFGTSSSW